MVAFENTNRKYQGKSAVNENNQLLTLYVCLTVFQNLDEVVNQQELLSKINLSLILVNDIIFSLLKMLNRSWTIVLVLSSRHRNPIPRMYLTIFPSFPTLYKLQLHKMFKHTQAICRQQSTNSCLKVFDIFVRLAFKVSKEHFQATYLLPQDKS